MSHYSTFTHFYSGHSRCWYMKAKPSYHHHHRRTTTEEKRKRKMLEVKRIGVVGSGQMGSGIAQVAAMHDIDVLASRPRPSSSLQSLLFHLFLHQPFRFQKPHLSGHTHQNQKNYFLILFFQFLASFSTPKKHFI